MTSATLVRPERKERTQTDFSALSKRIREANLLAKVPSFYLKRTVQVTLLALATWMVILLVGAPWWTLALAPVLGVLTAQYGFLAHEAAHSQVFNSPKVNKWYALFVANLFVGLSYGWWDKKKHNLHHANPNTEGKDPDLYMPILKFTPEDRQAVKGTVARGINRYQGWLFPFLLLFTGFDLLKNSYQALFNPKNKLDNRILEIALITIRLVAPFAILTVAGGWLFAAVFTVAQMMVLGLFMGGAFAPNHKGMPLIPKDTKVDYFRRQVLTSRDIKGGWVVDNLMGGLNYQVEHHLFPSMPRPNLKKAQVIVREFCEEKKVPYVETRLFQSYGIVINYLNEVGLKDSDPFMCPLVNQLRQLPAAS